MLKRDAIEILKSIQDNLEETRFLEKCAIDMGIEALHEPRPHGKWIFKYDNPLIKMGYWECSKCKQGRLMVEENFCPNCGADMREGEENE